MRLERLRLVNYRRFRDAQLEFPDGIVGIVGRNGAGKSSLLESVLWCLFGHDACRTGKELLKRQGAAPGEDVVARLEFELEGTHVTVTRRLRGKSLQPEASIEIADAVVVAPGANSWEQANAYLVRMLGFDRTSFEATVVAKQGELASLSELRPAQRKRVLLGLLGVDRIDQAVQAARGDARVLDARVDEARRLFADEPLYRAEHAQLTVDVADAATNLGRLQSELETVRRKHQLAAAAQEGALAAKLRDQELRARLQGLQSRLETVWGTRTRLAAETHLVRERLAEAPALRARVAAHEDLDERITRSDAARQNTRRRTDLVSRRKRIAADLDAAEKAGARVEPGRTHLQAVTDQLTSLRTEADTTTFALAKAATARDQARAGLAALAEAPPAPTFLADDDCPTCGRLLGDVAAKLAHLAEEAARARDSERATLEAEVERAGRETRRHETTLQRISKDRTRLERERAAAEVALRDATTAHDRAGLLRTELTTLDADLSALEDAAFDETAHQALLLARGERDKLRDALARVEETERRLERIQTEDRLLLAQEQGIVREREDASRELRGTQYEPGTWERAHEEAETSRRRLEATERDHVVWTERHESRQRQLVRLTQSLQRIDGRRAELKGLEDELRLLDALAARRGDDGILPEFRSHLMGRLRPALARAAGQLLGQMTHGRYAEVQLDEEYSACLFDAGTAHPLERFSGGEVDVCNLALRLAVSELVANARGRSRLQFVALDEVFGSQDEERRKAILGSLHALSGVFRQVFVVTHLDDVRERLEHIIRVEDAGDGTSRFTWAWTGPSPASPQPGTPPEAPPLVLEART